MDSASDWHCLELVARERSGHTAVFEENLLYVWGGYMSVADNEVFLPNDEIWVYDLERGVWQVFYMTGEIPPSMSGTCGCCLDGHLYIFGGYGDNGQTNQIYCVNLTDGKYKWRKITHENSSAPSPRDKLSCWVYNGRFIYFGGYGHKVSGDVHSRNRSFIVDDSSQREGIFWGWNNEVHVFDPKQASWSEPKIHGCAPAPRAAHASSIIGHRGYICGGRVKESRRNDIYCLDLESWTWSEIIPVSTAPVGRSWHSLTAVSDTSLFLFGGLGVECKPMSDGWLLDVEAKKWKEYEHPFKNKPRLWHTACLGKDSDVIVFGGSSHFILVLDTGHSNEALVFQMQPYPLLRICEDYIAKTVRNCQKLRNQLTLLPPKLLTVVQRRMTFYRPTKKQTV